MRLPNQTRTGNICNQNTASYSPTALRGLGQLASLHAFSALLHGVGQDTEPLDLHFEDIAGLHENGWLTRRSDATRRAGDDHITSLQTHGDTDHLNQRWDTEDQLVCARILHHAAI